MSQRTQQLEARLERVELELEQLKVAVAGDASQPWYKQIVGSFAGDDEFVEIIRLGRMIRQGTLKHQVAVR